MSLTAIALFSSLDQAALDRLQRSARRLSPRDGTTIFTQGEESDAVYAITAGDGCVRIGSSDRRSKALMVEVLRRGEIFGEIGVIDAGPRSATAVVQGEMAILKIPAAIFRSVLADTPALGLALCGTMAQRLRRTFALFQDATFEVLEVRLARQILYLAEREGRQTPQGIRLAHRLRQGDLADLLGGTTRSIITILNAWRASGLASYDASRAFLTIRDVPALRTIIDADVAGDPQAEA
jgi:CRP/FNR family transcriptional regulator, cyclic AMP receptor protein